MKYAKLSAGLVLAALMFAAIQAIIQQDKASVFGERVDESVFLDDYDAAVSFAQFVEPRLRDRLLERFDINTDDKSVQEFIDAVAPELGSSEKTRTDQENVTRLADALQAVVDGRISPDSAYDHFELSAVVDHESWLQMAANNDIYSVIQSMRQFANANTSAIEYMSRDSIRWIYVNRSIFEAICDIPEIANAIQSELSSGAVAIKNQSNNDDSGVANFECSVHASKYIIRELEENVAVRNPALSGYTNHIGLLDNVALDISNEQM